MNRGRGVLFSLCAAVLAANLWHLASQRGAPTFDDAWYLEVSFRLFFALKTGVAAFARAYADAFKIKAPLLSLTPLPLYFLFGPSEKIAVYANQFFLVLTWLFIYKAARRLYAEKAALCAVAAAALLPLLYGLSRLFFVECLLTALVAWAQWLILKTDADDPAAWPALGAALGLGLLAKSLFPLYLAGPVWLKRRELAPHAKRALLLGAAIAGTWYAFNLVYVAGYAVSAGFGGIARDYTTSLPAYALSLGRNVLSWPYLAAAAALAAFYFRRRRVMGTAERFLAAWFLPPLAVLTIGVNKDIRFLAPALPALAIFLGALAADAAARRGGAWILLLLALGPAAVFARQTFGPAGAALAYNGPPSEDSGWNRAALVDALAAQNGENEIVAVALEYPQLNANNLSSLAASRGLPLRFVSLGYAQTSAAAALIRLKDKGAGRLVLFEGALPPDLPAFLNRADGGVAAAVASGALPADRLASVAVAPGVTAAVYRLRKL